MNGNGNPYDRREIAQRFSTVRRKAGVRASITLYSFGSRWGRDPLGSGAAGVRPSFKLKLETRSDHARLLAKFFVVNPENGQVIQVFQDPLTNVVDAAFFPNCLTVASVYADKIFRVWSVAAGSVLYSKALDKEAMSLGVSPNGRYVVVRAKRRPLCIASGTETVRSENEGKRS